jgi:integrating conjugative element protein (TIGR03757 family)
MPVLLGLSVLLAGHPVQADERAMVLPQRIDVFTTTAQPVSTEAVDGLVGRGVRLEPQVYQVDGLQAVEAVLSHRLPRDPAAAERVVRDRRARWDAHDRVGLQQSATGLTKALAYGLDRVPAVVFDGQGVIYGVTDLGEALRRYQQWRGGG